MTSQAKHLKTVLKSLNLTSASGRISVRTEKTKAGEWGQAVSHVKALTNEEIINIKNADKFIEISNYPECGFAIVRY
jgi:hypothetical protein